MSMTDVVDGTPRFGKQYINGDWVDSTSKSLLSVHDSNNNSVCATVVKGSVQDTEKAIEAAAEAFTTWSRTSLEERKGYVLKILQEYMKIKDKVSDALQVELGAPKKFAENVQSNMFPLHLQTALEVADEVEWSKEIPGTLVVKEPIGVVGAITPWNWPLNQIGAKLAPALLSGCTMVLKPSEVTPINAFLVTEAIHAAGLPKGVFNMVMGTGPECGERLATHPKVDMVSFTGSTPVGRRLHALGAETIKRVRSELGGKSACVVLQDASQEQIRMMASHVIGNTGQSCNALSRMLVPKSRYAEICQIAKELFEGARVVVATDPSGQSSDIGPLASQMQYDKVRGYITRGLEEGATLLAGGLEKPEVPAEYTGGYFVKPTLFADVTNDMAIAREEIFGPVLVLIPYDTEAQAIAMANDTIYGLNAAVASTDETRAYEVAALLRAGQVQVNTLGGGPRSPFGGYKQSGDGREWGEFGFEDFLQTKAINKPAQNAKSRL